MYELAKEFFAWRTCVDILLIAAGLFFLYGTLRRLGTWKIMAGIIAAMTVFLMARLLDLSGIQWIYSNLSNVVIIALIVIFQPELRKIFERAVSLRRNETRDAGEELARMVTDALFAMAEQRQGAIIVFPGKEPVEALCSGGYLLNAQPSYPLLISIFDTSSPGHDGAMVIANGRFERFGVRLPISESAELPEEYGTRHHAAMGLAEKSDALILMVSEERGEVSVFHLGRMQPNLNPESLFRVIEAHWKASSSFVLDLTQGHKRRTFIFQMGASLALALFFWTAIIFSQRELVERGYTVPVEYSTSATSLVMVGQRKQEIQLYLGGTKSKLEALKSANLSVNIDISQFKPGTQSLFITNQHVQLPQGVKLIEAVPSHLELTLAQVAEHWAKVTPQLVGGLPAGVKIGSIEVLPDKVRVVSTNPEANGSALGVTTTPIYLENITRNATILCKIIAPQTIQPASKQWPDVEVTFTVIRQPL